MNGRFNSFFSPSLSARLLVAPAALVAALAVAGPAAADIKSPNDHPDYKLELEPQLLFTFIDEDGIGLGLRGTVELGDPAFIPDLNNTVGITFGFGWVNGGDDYCRGGFCYDWDRDFFFLPVAAQWNFWFTEHWSAFAELGLALQFFDGDDDAVFCNPDGCFRAGDFDDDDDIDIDPLVMVGGRFNFNENVALTLRLGYPTASFGVSIFF